MTDGGRAITGALRDEIIDLLGPLVPVSELDSSGLPVVTISSSKVEALAIIGAKRAKDSRGTIENHERGIMGEYAVAKYLRMPDQVDTEIYDGGDQGYDLVFRGKLIDVKTVGPQENNPSLRVSTHGDLRADFYVLAHQLNRSNYRIIGYAPRLQVKQSHTFTYSRSRHHWLDRYGDEVYIVEQNSLRPIARLGE